MSTIKMKELIKGHLQNVSVLKKRISDIENLKNDYKDVTNEILETNFDIALKQKTWKTFLSSPKIMEVVQTHGFQGEEVEMFLWYPFASELSKEEWNLIACNQEWFKNEKYEWLVGDDQYYQKWVTPLWLDYLMHARNDEEFHIMISKFKAYFDYKKSSQDWTNHTIAKKVVQLSYVLPVTYDVLYSAIENMKCETKEGTEHFIQLLDFMMQYKDELQDADDQLQFIHGYQKVLQYASTSLNKDIAAKRKHSFAKDLISLGKSLKVDVPEKVIKRLLYHEGDVIDVLFVPHAEWMKQEIEIYHNLQRERRNSFYSNSSYATYEKLVLLQRAVLDGKKAFLRLYQEQRENFKVRGSVALIAKEFYDVINVNTLNQETFEKAQDMKFKKENFVDVEGTITFQEFEFLNEAGKIQRKLFHLMNDWKLDEKLRVLRTLPSIKWNTTYFLKEHDFISILLQKMKEKDFRHYTKHARKGISKQSALFLEIFPKRFESVRDEIESDIDVELLMKYDIHPKENLLALKDRLYKRLPEIKSFTEFLEASPTFVEMNQKRFYEFYEKGLVNIVMKYKEDINEDQQRNLKLLAKAEIANKLKDVKFRDEDFAKEIGAVVSKDQREEWKRDRETERGNLQFEETSDFYHLINMGEIPTSTCQSWNGGSYNTCLLSIFDLNKKMVVAYKNDRVVARALVRLTKVNEAAGDMKKDLKFVDIEREEVSQNQDVYVNAKGERLVIFLERLYTSITGKERDVIENEIISLVKQKAKMMDVEMVTATSYSLEQKSVSLPIFISRSKNGNQYLDSLGGSSDESKGGTYHKASVYQVL